MVTSAGIRKSRKLSLSDSSRDLYIAPEAKHLTKRVEEIHEGAYDDLIEKIMQKPITDMEELYNNREIEK